MRVTKPDHPIILVEWIDSASTHGWVSGHEDSNVEVAQTVGFLVFEDKKVVKIVQTVTADGMIDELICIPKFAIVARMKVKWQT